MKVLGKEGFTLIELLVVISIIIILAGISLPAIGAILKSSALRDTAQTIQFAFIETKGRAIAEREKQYLYFFLKEPSGTIEINGENQTFSDHVLVSYDSNENTSGTVERVGETTFLNKNISFYDSSLNKINQVFYYTFDFDGAIINSPHNKFYIAEYKKNKLPSIENTPILIYEIEVKANIGNIEIIKHTSY